MIPFFRFAVAGMIPLILSGEKAQTIRLFADCSRVRPGDRFRLVEADDRAIGTAIVRDWRGLKISRDSASSWALDEHRDRIGSSVDLTPAGRIALANADGFRGPDPWGDLVTAMERFYVFGQGRSLPLVMIQLTWTDFEPAPGRGPAGDQLEMPQ